MQNKKYKTWKKYPIQNAKYKMLNTKCQIQKHKNTKYKIQWKWGGWQCYQNAGGRWGRRLCCLHCQQCPSLIATMMMMMMMMMMIKEVMMMMTMMTIMMAIVGPQCQSFMRFAMTTVMKMITTGHWPVMHSWISLFKKAWVQEVLRLRCDTLMWWMRKLWSK